MGIVTQCLTRNWWIPVRCEFGPHQLLLMFI